MLPGFVCCLRLTSRFWTEAAVPGEPFRMGAGGKL